MRLTASIISDSLFPLQPIVFMDLISGSVLFERDHDFPQSSLPPPVSEQGRWKTHNRPTADVKR